MDGVCQVDFYVLQDDSQSAEILSCRLAMMAWEQGHRTVVITENETESQRLDELMWSHPPGRFLPHARLADKGSAPVLIGTMKQLAGSPAEVVINLTSRSIPEPKRFRRLLEPVPAVEEQRKASREKFIAYRKLGLNPASHEINSKTQNQEHG